MSIFTRAKIFFLVAYSCLVSVQFFFLFVCFVPYVVHVAHTNGKNCISVLFLSSSFFLFVSFLM